MDVEKNLTLRKLREKLGYGLGWTFIEALKDWLYPKLVLIVILCIWFYIFSHIDISISWH